MSCRRDPQPWNGVVDTGRVQALLDAGNITNDMLPDFRAVQPTNLQVDSVMLEWGVEKVRFSISIANIGANNLQARNGAIITNATQAQIDYFNSLGLHVDSVRLASQELLDSNNKIAVSIPDATLSNYHHSHNHIHVAETARFSLEHYNISTGKWVVVPDRESIKQYFCLLDMIHISLSLWPTARIPINTRKSTTLPIHPIRAVMIKYRVYQMAF